MNFELLAIITLIVFAVGDLIVGVVNDAVNFLNSAIGSRVASRKTILLVACVGIVIGTTFSDGIIEVTRKGIFNPQFFTTTEVIIVFTAVAFTDIILLDLYSTFGLPTSTTVAVVFELMGAAFMMALLKMKDLDAVWAVINSASALKIITSILLSVGIAFIAGLITQFVTRLIFTFDYKEKIKRWGFLWSGVAMTALVFFILLKGSEHATFMTPKLQSFITSNTYIMLIISIVVFSISSAILLRLKVNILKVIVLTGTAALAMAFAGNDLANFIGVAVAGVHAFTGANLSSTLPTPSWVVILAGIIMSAALIKSQKAQTVSRTEVNLASHEKQVMQQWKKNMLSENFVKCIFFLYGLLLYCIPQSVQKWICSRWSRPKKQTEASAFDLIRAGVNLMVAAILISYATSQKLPLSTTYVTFMVAMGTALADGAWTRECGPSRINGIIIVVGGWFVTAFLAFFATAIVIPVLYYFKLYGLLLLLAFVSFAVYNLYHLHIKRNGTMSIPA